METPPSTLEAVVQHPCQLGEGPVWDAHTQTLLWIDLLGGDIHEFTPATGTHSTVSVGQMVGAVALRRGGGLVAALQHGFGFVNRQTGEVTMVASPEAALPGNRFNDGKCDPAGRFWAGTTSYAELPNQASLYCLEADGTVKRQHQPVSMSNGLAWSPDGQTLYYIDTPTYEVVAFAYDQATGTIRAPQTVIQFTAGDGYPDGMTIDAEGMLWVAFWGGWRVGRYNPHTGQLLHCIWLPVAQVTSCTFGGPELRDLYITSARTGLSEPQLRTQPRAGALFVLKDCGFQGLPTNEFNG
ncbi:SMP-30/gluconolactonase/LRE family protein [Hymenobacter monticola]|uniref:Regucalcin n=1 Tax=Hymenobacter monticola TaxID=1705399 RepID=A0ABY4BBE7_9BACT|nr:SMP-30/gluconolactonase/LRE family protein [Hymenobacter monticola]UOE36390.1 SMP-30/gluconolactonase/LRE family protein [Hymenobacter monticola]